MKITVVLGTRPEVIKLAPVILEGRKRGHEVNVVLTGQHRDLAKPLLKFFGIEPNVDLDVMEPNQTLTGLSARVLMKLDEHQDRVTGDCLLVQGDTTSAAMAGYWSFLKKIPLGHVEAGLRTGDLQNPFPEEANRQLIGRIADFHFAPTAGSRKALLAEKTSPKKVSVTGNTAIDALFLTLDKIAKGAVDPQSEDGRFLADVENWIGPKKLILVTAHRRENIGAPLEGICKGILDLVNDSDENYALLPVHPNPNVRETILARLGGHPRIRLEKPLNYVSFVSLMARSSLLLTDSGGVQEEGPSLRKPILVLRKTSERPEGIRKGLAKLVGSDPKRILKEGRLALRKKQKQLTSRGPNPYGDGKAAARILKILEKGVRR